MFPTHYNMKCSFLCSVCTSWLQSVAQKAEKTLGNLVVINLSVLSEPDVRPLNGCWDTRGAYVSSRYVLLGVPFIPTCSVRVRILSFLRSHFLFRCWRLMFCRRKTTSGAWEKKRKQEKWLIFPEAYVFCCRRK